MEKIKSILKKIFFLNCFRIYFQKIKYLKLCQQGHLLSPPPSVKQNIIKSYAQKHKIKTFIETGTYLGDMVESVKKQFDKIYSIELGYDLFLKAKNRFALNEHITILLGDSGNILKEILPLINSRCIFWLDGHYSEGITAKGNLNTPVQKEIEYILKHPLIKDHIILIDDARCFTGKDDYPTLDWIKKKTQSAGLSIFEVKNDIIRIMK